MSTSPLRARTVLLTRPGGIAEKLRSSISKAGGTAIHLPSMAIVPPADPAKAGRMLAKLNSYDALIFVSRNAVKYAHNLIPDMRTRARGKSVFAVGAGTGEELEKLGFTGVSYTHSNTGSEALLDMADLQSETVAGRKIMILRGVGGRKLLGDALCSRGARVEYAEVYRRIRPGVKPACIKHIWLTLKPDVVQLTSVNGLHNLLEMTGEAERPLFLHTPLVVISQRLKTVAQASGFKAAIKVASGYSDDDFMVALTEMFEASVDE